LGAENAVGLPGAGEGVILGDAVERPLQGESAGRAVPLAHRAAGIALGDGRDVGGADALDVVAVVVLEDGQGAAALLGQGDGAPLLEAGAGDRLAVAVLGTLGGGGDGSADSGV